MPQEDPGRWSVRELRAFLAARNDDSCAHAREKKELSVIDGTSPPIHYHSLLAELGAGVTRHREFLQYHAVRVYPAYLLAYKRVMPAVNVV